MARRRLKAGYAGMALAVVAVAAVLGLRAMPAGASKASAGELERLHAACVEAMLRSNCQVMSGPAASSTATVVFVAGVGPVDAKAYRELREAGEAMCGIVKKACLRDWDGAQCRTARGLYGSAPAPASR